MSTPIGWFESPADDRIMREAKALADEKVAQFKAYLATQPEVSARAASRPATPWTREQLRDRMGMIITIDRADTDRSISVLSTAERSVASGFQPARE